MAKQKEHMNLAFIGHVDHGKSTLVGHLLLQSGVIAEQQLSKEKTSLDLLWTSSKKKEREGLL